MANRRMRRAGARKGVGVQVPPLVRRYQWYSVRMSRFFKMFLAIGLVGLVVSPRGSAEAADNAPLPGTWGWCTESIVNGCIQSLTTISPDKVETVYTDSSAFCTNPCYSNPATLGKVFLDLVVTCDSIGPGQTCDGNRYESVADGSCREKTTWPAGRAVVPDLLIDVRWYGKSGWSVKVKLSTGNYRPAFTIGHGTTSAITTDDGDGTFTYTYTGEIEKNYLLFMPTGTIPGTASYFEWMATATAKSFDESVHVQVWPRDHLLDLSKFALSCSYYPFEGAWAEANAISFSWSYNRYPIPSGSTQSVPNKLYFVADNYHYLPQNGTEPLQIMPARVQVFMPAAYFTALGYSSVAGFDSSSYSVTAEDGQTVSPTVTARDGGLVINLGVQHYSSINPTLTFKLGPNWRSSTSKKDLIVSSKKAASLKSIATFVGLAQPKGSTISLRVWSSSSKICRVSGTALKAVKKGTCKATVTVKSRSGTKKSTTISLKVTT